MIDAICQDGHGVGRVKLRIIPVTKWRTVEKPLILAFEFAAFARPLLRALVAVVLLSACQSLPPIPQTTKEVSLQGRIKITLEEEVISSNLRWTQTEAGFEAYFWGAMGVGTTKVYGDARNLTIERRNSKYSGPAREILEHHLGWSLPGELLIAWVRGVPSDGVRANDVKHDDQGRLVSFRQAGWELRFESFDRLGRYTRLVASSDDASVLVVVKQRSAS